MPTPDCRIEALLGGGEEEEALVGLLDDDVAVIQNWVCILDLGPIVGFDCMDAQAQYGYAVVAVAVDNDVVAADDCTHSFAVSLCLWNRTMIQVCCTRIHCLTHSSEYLSLCN